MNHDLDDRLRTALRPVDPGPEFSRRVLARLASDVERPMPAAYLYSRLQQPRFRWLSAALAASVVLAIVGRHEWYERQEGIEARRQLIEALQITSDKLDLAYRVVNERAQSGLDGNAGA